MQLAQQAPVRLVQHGHRRSPCPLSRVLQGEKSDVPSDLPCSLCCALQSRSCVCCQPTARAPRHTTVADAVIPRVPPTSFFLVSAVFHYLGPALAVLLFAHVDVLGVAWLRIASAAVVFALWRRPGASGPWRADPTVRCCSALGIVLAAMNTLFYLAVDRLPLATVGAIEFLGTVALAAVGTSTRRNALALVLAIGRRRRAHRGPDHRVSRWGSCSRSPTASASWRTSCWDTGSPTPGHITARAVPWAGSTSSACRW